MSPVLSPMPKYVLNIPLSFANETGVFKVVEWILTCVVFLLLSNPAQLWLPHWNSLPVYFGRRSQNGVCTPHSQRSADTNGNEYVDWLILIYWEIDRRSWGMVDWLVVWLTNRPSDGPLTDALWQSDWLTVWQNDWLTDRATEKYWMFLLELSGFIIGKDFFSGSVSRWLSQLVSQSVVLSDSQPVGW